MSTGFGFVTLTVDAEAWLVEALDLVPVALGPGMGRAEGRWQGKPVVIETRVYRGALLRYARFAQIVGAGLEIGNILCLSDPVHPLPILGADLVALGRAAGMIAVDLSPTIPPGPARDAQLTPLALQRARQPALPPGGQLPAWCASWFSPWALYTRVALDQAQTAGRAFRDFPWAFVQAARASVPAPAEAARVAAVQAGYTDAHRTEDKGLGLLAKLFGAAWAERYVADVLFPRL